MKLRKKSYDKLAIITLLLLIVFFACRYFVWVIWDNFLMIPTTSWSRTKGVIVGAGGTYSTAQNVTKKAGVRVNEDENADQQSYALDITYEYTVDDEKYEGKNIECPSIEEESFLPQASEKKYKRHDVVDVFYLPYEPETSCLEGNKISIFKMTSLAGIGVLLMGAVGFIFFMALNKL